MNSRRALMLSVVLGLAACQTMVPALSGLLASFAQDWIAAASVNHTPRYALQVESLLVALLNQTTGARMQGQLAQSGYQPPPLGHQQQSQQPDTYPDAPAYADQDYGSSDYGDSAPSYADSDYYATRGIEPIRLDNTLLVRKAGQAQLATVDDGDTLRDGNNDPAQGDLLKFHFAVNCACFVYVVGVDATGYVARIFPEGDTDTALQPGRQYLIPQGDEWWGLDNQKGIEQVYFVASYGPRPDIETALQALAEIPRGQPQTYRSVAQPAIVPVRGLVKVKADPVNLTPTVSVTPESVLSETGNDVVVSRWFRHE